MRYILALDIGTSGVRTIAFDKHGKIAAKSHLEIAITTPKPGWVEQNPQQIWHKSLQTLQTVISQVGVEHIESLGITNQRESIVIWDKNTSQPLYPTIVWQDTRTKNICQQLIPHQQTIKQKTGLMMYPYFSGTKIAWLFDTLKPNIDQCKIGTIDSWILWNLTQGTVHATEPSNACRTLLFNINTLEYDASLISILGLPKNITASLPKVIDSDSHFGNIHSSLLGKEIPIQAILGDQQAALYAHTLFEEGSVKNTYGTGLFVMTSTGSHPVISQRLVSTIAGKINNNTFYALEGSILSGGATIQWLRDQLKIISQAAETEQLAQSIPSNEGVYFVPAFSGLGAPHWDNTVSGSILGLTRKSSRAHFARAALESIAYQTRDVIETIKKEYSTLQVSYLIADGGATANNFLMQFQSDILNLPVNVFQAKESTSIGIAKLVAFTTNFWDQTQPLIPLDTQHKSRQFLPQMNSQDRSHYYSNWKKSIQAIKAFHTHD